MSTTGYRLQPPLQVHAVDKPVATAATFFFPIILHSALKKYHLTLHTTYCIYSYVYRVPAVLAPLGVSNITSTR